MFIKMDVIKNDQRRLVTDFTDFEAPLVVRLELAPSQVPTPRFLCAGLFLGALAIQHWSPQKPSFKTTLENLVCFWGPSPFTRFLYSSFHGCEIEAWTPLVILILKIVLLDHLKMNYQKVGRRSIARAACAPQPTANHPKGQQMSRQSLYLPNNSENAYFGAKIAVLGPFILFFGGWDQNRWYPHRLPPRHLVHIVFW